MIRKTLLAGVFTVMSSASFAAVDSGCGVGTMIWEGKEGFFPNWFALTTNGTLGNQTFGMTTGTLGCDNSSPKGWMTLNGFLDSNLEKVARDMSRGEGEALSALAEVMAIDAAAQPKFFSVSKENFDRIFSSADVTRAQVVSSLAEIMAEDAELAQYAPQA